MGLVIAGGAVMARAADTGWRSVAVTIAAAAIMLVTRLILCGCSLRAALSVLSACYESSI
jgi:hypothetical protein